MDSFNQLVAAAESAVELRKKANAAARKCDQAIAAAKRAETRNLPRAERERLVGRATKASKAFCAASKEYRHALESGQRLMDQVVATKTAKELVRMGREDLAFMAFRDS